MKQRRITKTLDEYAREWQGNAEADALWVILTDSQLYGKKWNVEDFFATGAEEIGRIFRFVEQSSIPVPSGVFLDFGCGVGRISKALRKKFARGYGIDISQKMIDLARVYVPDVAFTVNQTDSLEHWGDSSVDFVYSHIVLQHIPNEYQRRYIDEFLRIMRPGGLAVFQIPVEIINPQDIKPPFAYRVKQEIKRVFPFLIALKRRFVPPKRFHYEFKYEMHPLADKEIRNICEQRGCVIEASPATNSCEPEHNGRIEFYNMEAQRRMLREGGLPNRYLSCMYFVRKPNESDL